MAATQASAASVTVLEPCVINAGGPSQMSVTGSGFTPEDTIELQTITGAAAGTATADANGNFGVSMTAPTLPDANLPGASSFTLIATDAIHPLPVTPTATFLVANLAVNAKPANALPGKRVTWTFSGFTSGAKIYAHYLHAGKVTATAIFGRASGPCGVLQTKALVYPGREKYRTYNLQVDDSRRYSARALPRWTGRLTEIRP
jgi:hypothetical protein